MLALDLGVELERTVGTIPWLVEKRINLLVVDFLLDLEFVGSLRQVVVGQVQQDIDAPFDGIVGIFHHELLVLVFLQDADLIGDHKGLSLEATDVLKSVDEGIVLDGERIDFVNVLLVALDD